MKLSIYEHELEVLQTVLNRILVKDFNEITPSIHEYRTLAGIAFKLQHMGDSDVGTK